ncbi:DUF2339 domain-containing protein [Larkinella rosea]|uniref:DUF2339 domain-containing protein n=1 Tax=Larkinella rosea TaxID=2025312 RepID=A0A3P1BJ18_9BACT|nr:DUF2339 domain-containing protein [Larkinella rosea]RRB01110.1 DUF2339 domain-containing protein [Larkinella rosea]
MEAFLLVIVIVLILIGFSRFSDVKQLVQHQNEELGRLRADLSQIRSLFETGDQPVSLTKHTILDERGAVIEVTEEAAPPIIIHPEPESIPEPVIIEPPVFNPEGVLPPPIPQVSEEPAAPVLPTLPPVPAEPQLSFFQRFLRDNPDLEKFIGENLINKIGIGILVLGIGYFVKYAIDQNWINEIGRVLIGILAGGALIGVAHRLRNSFGAFSSVLVGGGLAVLYFTIAIAFQDYHIFSQTTAFVIMVVITGFSILLAITYNRVELAVVSLVGGFATPFMVSTGEGNYVVLLTYILILDVGMLVLAYFKKWNLVHIVAYGFTVLLYGAWLSDVVIDHKLPAPGAFVFATLFYVVFMAMNLINNLKENTRFSALEISLLLSSTAFFFAAGMVILENSDHKALQGLFTVALAVINFGLATFLYRREAIDRNLIYLLIGLVITFVSLAIPIQLEGNFITMFWALEAVLLLWLSQKSGLKLISTASILVLGLMFVSLGMDWAALYGADANPPMPIILNKAFVTSIVSVVGLVATLRLLNTQTAPFQFWIGQLEVHNYRSFVRFMLILTLYLAGIFELDYQTANRIGFGPNQVILMGCYNLAFATGLLFWAGRAGQRGLMWITTGLGLVGMIAYLATFSPATMELLNDYFLRSEPSLIGFPVHYFSVVFALLILWFIDRNKARLEPLPPILLRLWPWFMGYVIVYISTSELFAHVIYFSFAGSKTGGLAGQPAMQRFDELLIQINKVGLPILWGVCAFVFMWVGLNRKNRQLRILSLSLFGLTIAKLFLYDIQGISEGGKIAAFISLGVLLLVISFMYQKIRKLILIDDTHAPQEPVS